MEIISVPLKAAGPVLFRMDDSVGKLLSHSWAGGGIPKHNRPGITGVSDGSQINFFDGYSDPHQSAPAQEEIL